MNYLGATLLLAALTFILNNQAVMRTRIILFVLSAIAIGVVAFIVMMSIPMVRDMFLDRFTLVKSYDAGETGRFGIQVRSIPFLLGRPFGFGPTYFRVLFGADPHNVYLNAFSSYGWLGGISYICLIICTIMAGLKTIFTKTPWQNAAVVVFCPLLTTILQGVQIDTDHWRHFYWMMGLMWGLFAATLQPSAVVGGWEALGKRLMPSGFVRQAIK